MRGMFIFAVLAALVAIGASGQEPHSSDPIAKGIAGIWELSLAEPNLAEPNNPGPLPLGSSLGFPTTLTLQVNGDRIGGSARMGGWPGNARISAGKINGERIAFTMVGELPYCQNSRCAVPIFDCIGIVSGGKIEITFAWGQPGPIKLRLKGEKTSN